MHMKYVSGQPLNTALRSLDIRVKVIKLMQPDFRGQQL